MRCEEVRERFAEYLAGSLDAGDATALEQHVASCAECQAEYAGVEVLWRALADVPAPPVPSNRMRERFSATLAAERASADRRPASRLARGRTWAPRSWTGEPLVQMALAASLLLVGVLVGRALPGRGAVAVPQPASEIAEVRSELRDMRQMLTLSLLQQQSATERLRGVNWTAQIDQPGTEVVSALLDTLLHDPNVNVRLAAVDALRRFSDRADVRLGTKRAIVDTSSPLLQVAVIDFMVDTRDPQAPALFRSLTQDASVDEAVRGRAQWGLDQFAS
ncbi:MAG TPA: HEAT repeat domain-containing protein [Vicinamibacterales bacterium]|nr:HEAT repeat domain-containing protein [Vicinamibacterales bacterium]